MKKHPSRVKWERPHACQPRESLYHEKHATTAHDHPDATFGLHRPGRARHRAVGGRVHRGGAGKLETALGAGGAAAPGDASGVKIGLGA